MGMGPDIDTMTRHWQRNRSLVTATERRVGDAVVLIARASGRIPTSTQVAEQLTAATGRATSRDAVRTCLKNIRRSTGVALGARRGRPRIELVAPVRLGRGRLARALVALAGRGTGG